MRAKKVHTLYLKIKVDALSTFVQPHLKIFPREEIRMANNTRFSADLTARAHEFNDKYPQEIYDAIHSVIIYNPDFHYEAPTAVRERLKWMNEVSTFIAGAWG